MDEMDVINVLDVMNVKDVTDIIDVPNEINGLNARAWVPVLVIVFIFVFSHAREIELVLGGFPCQGFRAFPHARVIQLRFGFGFDLRSSSSLQCCNPAL